MRLSFILLSVLSTVGLAQVWEVENHPNSGFKRIVTETNVSDYIYSEISEISEGKSYVAKGELYAYINDTFKDLTPFVFAEANNFKNGFAVVGDSFSKSLINSRMHIVVPFNFFEVRLPKYGLVVAQNLVGNWGAYDTLGNLKLPFVYDLPPQILNLDKIIVRKEELYGVVNDCNDVLFNCNYQYISKKGLGYKSGKYIRLFE